MVDARGAARTRPRGVRGAGLTPRRDHKATRSGASERSDAHGLDRPGLRFPDRFSPRQCRPAFSFPLAADSRCSSRSTIACGRPPYRNGRRRRGLGQDVGRCEGRAWPFGALQSWRRSASIAVSSTARFIPSAWLLVQASPPPCRAAGETRRAPAGRRRRTKRRWWRFDGTSSAGKAPRSATSSSARPHPTSPRAGRRGS